MVYDGRGMRGRQRCKSRGWLLFCSLVLYVGFGCGRGPLRIGTRDAGTPDRTTVPDAPLTTDTLTEIRDVRLPDGLPDLAAEAQDLPAEARDLAAETGAAEVKAVDAGNGADICIPSGCHDPNCFFDYCGKIGDGCGGTLDCGSRCLVWQVCGLDGMCKGDESCIPLNCDNGTASRYCGDIGDGCGGGLHCGTDCGRAGWVCENHICVGRPPGCEPLPCDTPSERLCGKFADGCGGIQDCGTCPQAGWFCSSDNRCIGGPECVPMSCDGPSGEKYCGAIGDGCGGRLLCASACPGSGSFCRDNLCVQIAGCSKVSCVLADGGSYCGIIGDGCGGARDCGTACPDGSACGSVRANQCGAGTSSPPPAAPRFPLLAPPVPVWLDPPPPPPPFCPSPPAAPEP
jgi:hypothetical protein